MTDISNTIPEHSDPNLPVLYSFRRCPYAMRARMALAKSGVTVALREVDLKNKPEEMLDASPKGSVPVLVLPDDTVVDESRDIMEWALKENDPDNWLAPGMDTINNFIDHNDKNFKKALDRYKYPNRYPNEDCSWAQDSCLETFKTYEEHLTKNDGFLAGPELSMADIAVFPFVRQCAFVDKDWFDNLDLPRLQRWLKDRLESPLFKMIMLKTEPWASGQTPVYMAATKSMAA